MGEMVMTLIFAAIGFWGCYQLGVKKGKTELWNALSKTLRQSLRDLL